MKLVIMINAETLILIVWGANKTFFQIFDEAFKKDFLNCIITTDSFNINVADRSLFPGLNMTGHHP